MAQTKSLALGAFVAGLGGLVLTHQRGPTALLVGSLFLAAFGVWLLWRSQDEVLRAIANLGFSTAFWLTLSVGLWKYSALPTPSWLGREPLLSALLVGWLAGYAIAIWRSR